MACHYYIPVYSCWNSVWYHSKKKPAFRTHSQSRMPLVHHAPKTAIHPTATAKYTPFVTPAPNPNLPPTHHSIPTVPQHTHRFVKSRVTAREPCTASLNFSAKGIFVCLLFQKRVMWADDKPRNAVFRRGAKRRMEGFVGRSWYVLRVERVERRSWGAVS